MLDLLLSLISLMLLNDEIFSSDGVAMFSLLITHLNPSSRENLLLAISDLTCLKMRLGESSIDSISAIIPATTAVVPIQTTAPPFSKMGRYYTNDSPIYFTDRNVQFRSLLFRIPRLDLNHTGEPATQLCNNLRYAGFASVIDILDVTQ